MSSPTPTAPEMGTGLLPFKVPSYQMLVRDMIQPGSGGTTPASENTCCPVIGRPTPPSVAQAIGLQPTTSKASNGRKAISLPMKTAPVMVVYCVVASLADRRQQRHFPLAVDHFWLGQIHAQHRIEQSVGRRQPVALLAVHRFRMLHVQGQSAVGIQLELWQHPRIDQVAFLVVGHQ